MKTCTHCKRELPLTAFPWQSKLQDRRHARCRDCRRAYQTQYHAANLDKFRGYQATYRARHPDAVRASERASRVRNRERIAERTRQHRIANADRIRMVKAAYRAARAEAIRSMQRAQKAVYKAKRAGRLVKPSACQRCGATERRITAAHHDYSKPLDVVWLCSPCHASWDYYQPKLLHRAGQ